VPTASTVQSDVSGPATLIWAGSSTLSTALPSTTCPHMQGAHRVHNLGLNLDYRSVLRHSGPLTQTSGRCNPPFPPLMPVIVAPYLAKDILAVNSVSHVRMRAWSWGSHIDAVCSCTRLQSIVPTHRHTCPAQSQRDPPLVPMAARA
jgi:hypothetical protein